MPAASRQSDCRPSAPIARCADSKPPWSRPNPDDLVFRADLGSVIVEPGQIGKFGGAFFQRRYQQAVLDVVAKHIETDLVAGKPDFGRTNETPGVVDQAHLLQLGRLVLAARPHIQPLQKIDRTAQQRRGPVVGIGRAPGDQGRARPGLRQRNRSRQPGGPATDHDDVVGDRCIVHTGTIDVPGGIFKPGAASIFPPNSAAPRVRCGCTNRGDS